MSRPQAPDPIFVGGEPRSGTTLLRVILDSHPAIACGPESQFLADPRFEEFHRYFRDRWASRAEGFGYAKDDLDDLFRGFVTTFFERYAAKRGKRRWADKTPQTIWILPYLWKLFPTARFVHMVRDGRDVACSVLEQDWGPKDVEEAAARWVKSIECGKAWRGDPRYLEVRYEDLVAHTEREVRRVLAHVGEPFVPQVLEYWRQPHDWQERNRKGAEQTSKPVYDESVGRWKRDLRGDALARYVKIAGPTLKSLGYA